MHKFFFLLFFPLFLNAEITVQSPLNNQYTAKNSVEFNFVSDQNYRGAGLKHLVEIN